MKISSVYITKDEEDNIAKSLDQIQDISDEIIIVDTGSTDRTVEICKNYGCKIFTFEWCNDFSKARNYAISLCKNEIIIFLDADEYFSRKLTIEDKNAIIKNFEEDKNLDALGCKEIDIDKKTLVQHHTSYLYKIFKKKEDIKFYNKIHEVLDIEGRELNISITEDLQLIHTGYSEGIAKNKVKRNLEILNQLENKKAMDYFYLGRENLFSKNYEEAEKNLDIFLNHKEFPSLLNTSNIAYLGYIYKIQVMQDRNRSKKELIEYALYVSKQIPHIPEIYFILGKYYINVDFKKSMKYFEQCIKLNEDFGVTHFELNNFATYQPMIYYYMAKVHFMLDERNKAIDRAIVSCMLDRRNKECFSFLSLLLNEKKTEENIELISSIYGLNGNIKKEQKEAYEFVIKCLSTTKLRKEFVYYCFMYNHYLQGGQDDVYYAMMLQEDYKIALDSLKNFDNSKGHFISTVILIYCQDEKLKEEYISLLPKEYKQIIEAFYSHFMKNTENIDIELLAKIISRLINFDFYVESKEVKNMLIKNANSKEFLLIVNCLNNMEKYKYNYLLFKDRELKTTEEKVEYLYTLFRTEHYNDFVKHYKEFLVDVKNNGLALLRIIPNAKLNTANNKIKKDIIRQEG